MKRDAFPGVMLFLAALALNAVLCFAGDTASAMQPARSRNVVSDSGTELAERALIVMTFLNGPGYFGDTDRISDREKIDAYKREVNDMVKLRAAACALDAFNIPVNRERIKLFSKAIEEYNQERPGTDFAFFLLLDLPRASKSAWENMNAVYACFGEIKNKYYATMGGCPVIGTWHGEQLGAAWWKGLSDLFAAKEGRGICVYNNFVDYKGKRTADYIKELKDKGIRTAYYHFITGNDAALDANDVLRQQMRPLGIGVADGICSSFWATCSTKPNSGRYVEFEGYAWMMRYFGRVLKEEPLNGLQHTWVTIWSDYGEDNFFVPAESPAPFFRNRKIPVWTHRGFYKLLQYYTTWWAEGKAPAMSNEAIYWCHRQHPKDLPSRAGDQCSETRFPHTKEFLPTWNSAKDAIFVVTRLNQPATLEVRLGNAVHRRNCEPGIIQHQFDWAADRGKPRFALLRNGTGVLAAEGKLEITDSPRDIDGGFTRNMHQYADYAETTE